MTRTETTPLRYFVCGNPGEKDVEVESQEIVANEDVGIDLAEFGEEKAEKSALVGHDVAGEAVARLGHSVGEVEGKDLVRGLGNA